MAVTVTLTDARPISTIFDRASGRIIVRYERLDDTGRAYDRDDLYVWVEMPDTGMDPEGNPLPPPPNWSELPPQLRQPFRAILAYIEDLLGSTVNAEPTV